MTVRTTMPIASRRAFVGLGAGVLAAALSASAEALRRRDQSRDFGVASLNHVFHIGILRGAVHHGEVSFIEKGEYMPKLNWKLLTKKRGSST